jgi:hypothetical protein
MSKTKESTPTKPQKLRKIAASPLQWPFEYEDIDHMWARDAIFHGNAAILSRYLREADEIDPRVRRELAEMLNPTSNHAWRLDARYRFRGTPTKQAKRWKTTLNAVLAPLARLLSGTDTIDARCKQSLAEQVADRVSNLRQIIGRSLRAASWNLQTLLGTYFDVQKRTP